MYHTYGGSEPKNKTKKKHYIYLDILDISGYIFPLWIILSELKLDIIKKRKSGFKVRIQSAFYQVSINDFEVNMFF